MSTSTAGDRRALPALWQEIHEQPAAAERTLAALEAEGPRRAASLGDAAARGDGSILLAGSGTSRHAAEIAAGWFREAGIPASATAAGEIRGALSHRLREGCLVAVTQSGATGSVLRLLDQAREEGIFRVVVTNEAASEATRRADVSYVTRAGPERAIPATKTFTSALLALRIFRSEWAAAGRTPESGPPGAPDIHEVPRLLREALGSAGAIERFVTGVRADRTWFFLASGPLLPLAAEGALKMMETAVVPAITVRAEELAHGPFAVVDGDTPVVLLSGTGGTSPGEARSLRALAAAGAPLLRLASEDGRGKAPGATAGSTISCPDDPALHPFSAAPALQLLALFAGRQLGRDVDSPAGLQKAVHDD